MNMINLRNALLSVSLVLAPHAVATDWSSGAALGSSLCHVGFFGGNDADGGRRTLPSATSSTFTESDNKMVNTTHSAQRTSDSRLLNADKLINALDLEPLAEGGYYRRTFESDSQLMTETPDGPRFLMSSIYFLLTQDAPINHFHMNRSDIVHYYHLGDALEYSLVFPDGRLKTVVMGADVIAGQCLQLHVPGGVWKASRLLDGAAGYGLISEAVSPGFDYADMAFGHRQALTEHFPAHATLIEQLTKE